MQDTNLERGSKGSLASSPLTIDPLDEDNPQDVRVATTERGLLRLVCVAIATVSRFDREGTDDDLLVWLATPRRLFGGRSALQACLEREDCILGILLQEFSMDPDAPPEAIVDLILREDVGPQARPSAS